MKCEEGMAINEISAKRFPSIFAIEPWKRRVDAVGYGFKQGKRVAGFGSFDLVLQLARVSTKRWDRFPIPL